MSWDHQAAFCIVYSRSEYKFWEEIATSLILMLRYYEHFHEISKQITSTIMIISEADGMNNQPFFKEDDETVERLCTIMEGDLFPRTSLFGVADESLKSILTLLYICPEVHNYSHEQCLSIANRLQSDVLDGEVANYIYFVFEKHPNLRELFPDVKVGKSKHTNLSPEVKWYMEDDHKMVTDNLYTQSVLGKGCYGTVYLVQLYNKFYASKCQRISETFLLELSAMKKMKHDCVVKYENFYLHKNHGYILMEICNYSLTSAIKCDCRKNEDWVHVFENINPPRWQVLPLTKRRVYQRDIISGLKYLHENGIVHKDLRSKNILVKDGRAKICDFGYCTLNHSPNNLTRLIESVGNAGPEFCYGLNIHPNFSSDVWSLGSLLLEIELGIYPFFDYESDCSDDKIQLRLMSKTISGIDESGSSELKGIVEDENFRLNLMTILSPNPRDRPTMQEISDFF